MTQYKVLSGQTVSGHVLNNLDTQSVISGTANATTVNSGGIDYVYSKGLATGSIINTGGVENVYSGGIANSSILSGGTQFVGGVGVGTLNGAAVYKGGVEALESGATAKGIIINSGGLLEFEGGGTASGTVVNNGGGEYIYSGGTASATTVANGGSEYVLSGGQATGTKVANGAAEFISAGAVVSNVVVSNGGQLTLSLDNGQTFSGKSGAGVTVNTGAVVQLTVDNGALAKGVTLASGGFENVLSGGTISGTTLTSGSFVALTGGTGSATIISAGSNETVFSGGLANGTKIYNGGADEVFSGGQANSITVQSGGSEKIHGGAVVSGLTVNKGGLAWVELTSTQSTIPGLTVQSGGILQVQVDSGVSYSSTVSSGDQVTVISGGTETGTILSGGVSYVSHGGTGSGETISGTDQVFSGGSVQDSTVYKGGDLIIADGGKAINDVIATSGTIEFVGSAGSDQSVSFANSTGGTLQIDHASTFAGVISAFAFGDTIKLGDVTSVKSAVWSGGVLVVTPTTGSVVDLSLPGDYSGVGFASAASGNGVAITEKPMPTISTVAFNESTGTLTLTGTHLTKAGSDYTVADFTVTGDKGTTYTLSDNTDKFTPNAAGTSVAIKLGANDWLAVGGLFNSKGTAAVDNTPYNLATANGWDTGAIAISTKGVNESATITQPTISSIKYDAAVATFTFSGAHLVNHGAVTGIALDNFTLTTGTGANVHSFSFNSSDKVSLVTASSFTVTLSHADQSTVNTLLAVPGKVGASAVWDSDLGVALSNKVVAYIDLFVLSSSAANVAIKEASFVEGEGQIDLKASAFAKLSATDLASEFTNGSSASTPTNYLYYNASNGGLYYDADGNGAGKAHEIAVIGTASTGHPTALSVADFHLY